MGLPKTNEQKKKEEKEHDFESNLSWIVAG